MYKIFPVPSCVLYSKYESLDTQVGTSRQNLLPRFAGCSVDGTLLPQH